MFNNLDPHKTIVSLLLFIFFANCLPAQDSCFENCAGRLKYSSVSPPGDRKAIFERSEKISAELIGCKAPDFSLETLDGERINLSDLKGKIVVLNFWFIECAPCIAEMPALNKLAEEYQDSEVVFVAFGRNDKESLIRFGKKHKFKYKVVASDFNFANKYCIVSGWPTNMVLDRNGVLRKIFTGGFLDDRAATHAYKEIKPVIEKYLLEK